MYGGEGRRNIKMKRISLSKITGKVLGKSFEEMPCHKLLDTVYNKMLQVGLPTQVGHLNLENGSDWFVHNPQRTMMALMRHLASLGVRVPIKNVWLLDLVVTRQMGGLIFPGIYVGRNKILTSTHREGVVVAPLGRFNKPVIVRRVVSWV